MWALRRVPAHSLKAQGLNVAAFRPFATLGLFSNDNEDKSSNNEHPVFITCSWPIAKTCYPDVLVSSRFLLGRRSLSSQAGAKSGGEEEGGLEEGFSELESPEASESEDIEGGHEAEDSSSVSESDSESDLSCEDENLEETLDSELMKEAVVEADKTAQKKRKGPSALCKLIMQEPGPSIFGALDRYVADGKELSHPEIYDALLNLRKRKLYGKALQFSEWLEKNKKLEFSDRDYASRVDLLAKVRGLQKAENYIDNLPQSNRKELVYRTLLANTVSVTNVEKAEEIFNKMKDLGVPMTAFACNQLLLLYKKTDRKKIADVLLMMEKENVKPSLFSYQILIDTKGQSNDLTGMDQVVETMKAEGVQPNTRVKATLAKHFAAAGLKDKAEEILKEMEGSDIKKNRWLCPILMPIYADLGKGGEVERIWKVCESKPQNWESLAAITSWGKLKDVDRAEAVFDKMSKVNKKLTSSHYTAMLKVYANNKLLHKGKELLKQMGDSGCHIGPQTWDAIVKLYVDAGEVEKADSVLQRAAQQKSLRPLFSSYMTIMDQYAKRGDIHNAEKIFHRMRQSGYVARARPFHALLQAYIKAKAPAYGFRERMKADNIFPNKALAAQLAQADAFRKTAVSELLD